VWSSTAQVRRSEGELHFGERVMVIERFGTDVEIRTGAGLTGWVQQAQLMPRETWQRALDESRKAQSLPVMGRGHTKVLTNLRLDPGRDGARLLQLSANVPVEMLERRVVAEDEEGGAKHARSASHGRETSERKDEWWMVRATVKEAGAVAGWVIGRFIAPDLPDPLPEAMTSAGMRPVAWFELNHVPDGQGGEKAQYLVAGTREAEGGACDFAMLRGFTWGAARERYETAYVENNLCGMLPISVTPARELGGESQFEFRERTMKGEQAAKYRMVQTIIRREGAAPRSEKKHRR
jgi:hypothetical protein